MNTDETARLAQALDSVADQERSAILDGDFDGLTALSERKAALISRLDEIAMPDTRPLTRLHRKLARNQALLNSAMQGIREVQARLTALREVREGLRTYDARGQRLDHSDGPGGTIERRA